MAGFTSWRKNWMDDGWKMAKEEGNWDDAQLVYQFRLWLVQPRFFFHQAADLMNVAVANEQGSARSFIQ